MHIQPTLDQSPYICSFFSVSFLSEFTVRFCYAPTQLQSHFLLSHEYVHHFHHHCSFGKLADRDVWARANYKLLFMTLNLKQVLIAILFHITG